MSQHNQEIQMLAKLLGIELGHLHEIGGEPLVKILRRIDMQDRTIHEMGLRLSKAEAAPVSNAVTPTDPPNRPTRMTTGHPNRLTRTPTPDEEGGL